MLFVSRDIVLYDIIGNNFVVETCALVCTECIAGGGTIRGARGGGMVSRWVSAVVQLVSPSSVRSITYRRPLTFESCACVHITYYHDIRQTLPEGARLVGGEFIDASAICSAVVAGRTLCTNSFAVDRMT